MPEYNQESSKGYMKNTLTEGSVIISWEDLYEYETSLNSAIGAKERFILLSAHAKKIVSQPDVIKILDGGGTNETSYVLKNISRFFSC